MAGEKCDRNVLWPDILVFDEKEVREIFKSYEICRFTEHKTSGKTPQGIPHDWHIFSVVAKKSNNALQNRRRKKTRRNLSATLCPKTA